VVIISLETEQNLNPVSKTRRFLVLFIEFIIVLKSIGFISLTINISGTEHSVSIVSINKIRHFLIFFGTIDKP